jgi:serine protease AprX
MKHVKILLFFLYCSSFFSNAQTHWVVFTDKNGTEFNPYGYFDPLAIQRRIDMGYDLYHYSDYPVNGDYIMQVTSLSDSVSYALRWMNALSVWATPEQIEHITELAFVEEIIPIHQHYVNCGKDNVLLNSDTSKLLNQLLVMEGHLYEDAGIDGYGVRIAVLDAGFPYVDTHAAFEHLRKEGRIIKTWDFVRKREHVYGYNAHGSMVLSNIAGIYEGQKLGLATGAEFLLARTEKSTEPFSEEVNWAAALEWADQNGAHIVNSSLGYTYHRYFPFQMDGQTAFVSKIANKAASKGILVVNAAGNDGNAEWTIIGAPADADSILTVGGINPATDYRIGFSSFGPTADFRRKPNVVAYGETIVAGKKGTRTAFGTSFASPLVAGFAACAKQVHPSLSATELKEIIEKSGRLYPYFDYGHGYGVPRASFILNPDLEMPSPTFSTDDETGSLQIHILYDDKVDGVRSGFKYDDYLYFAYSDARGVICEWGIINVEEKSFSLPSHIRCPEAKMLQLHYRGYTLDIQLPSF